MRANSSDRPARANRNLEASGGVPRFCPSVRRSLERGRTAGAENAAAFAAEGEETEFAPHFLCTVMSTAMHDR